MSEIAHRRRSFLLPAVLVLVVSYPGCYARRALRMRVTSPLSAGAHQFPLTARKPGTGQNSWRLWKAGLWSGAAMVTVTMVRVSAASTGDCDSPGHCGARTLGTWRHVRLAQVRISQ